MTTDSPDDREALVRFDLARTARRVHDDCAVLVIETASTPAHWQAAARNLERARTRHGSSVPGLHAASVAAEYLASGELGDALASLAGACGMDADEWLTLTRDERGAEAS